MLNRAGCLGSIAFAIWAYGASVAWAGSTLVVQVRTDLVAGRDFDTAVSTVRGVSNSAVQRINKPASPGQDWRRGVRVAEFRLDDGQYRLMVGLRHRRLGMRVERPARVTLKGGVRVITILLTWPPEQRPQTATGSASASPPPASQLVRPPAGSLSRVPPGASSGPLPQPTGKLSGRTSCGGPKHVGCGQGDYCALEPGKCRNPMAKGVCRKRPGCFSGTAVARVCGCDGRTYPNSCVAAANGVNVLHSGRCRGMGRNRR